MDRRLFLMGVGGLASTALPACAADHAPAAALRAMAAGQGMTGSHEAVQRLGERLMALDADGLDPAWYGLNPGNMRDPQAIARAATEALPDLVHGRIERLPGRVDLRRQRDPAVLEEWSARLAASPEPAAVIEDAAMRPEGMAALKAALAEARQIATQDWPQVPPGRRLDPGTTERNRIPALRARLAATDPEFAADPGDGPRYDPALVAAVRRFQVSMGLEPDARIGPATMAALNQPSGTRAMQLGVAMDMRRGAPPPPEERHVDVNIPNFRLKVAEGMRSLLEMDVIVGRPGRDTPMITTRLTAVQFNPPWGVPQRLAREDLLPRFRRDPQAMVQSGFRVFQVVGGQTIELDPMEIDWNSVNRNRFPYFVRQDAGDANALGRLKFIMPNGDDIFLHDTPTRSLFRRVDRAFSAGCIRLSQPMAMLLTLLEGNNGWNEARAQRMIDSGRTVITRLDRPLPIRLHYDTVQVDADIVTVRQDIYGLDAAYAAAMGRPRATPVAARD